MKSSQFRISSASFSPFAVTRLYDLARLSKRVHRQYAHRLSGLSESERRVLALFAADQDLSFKQACEAVAMDPARTSRLIQRLVRRGLFSKALDPLDQRRIRISLTARGRHLHASLQCAENGLQARWLTGMPARDREQFFKALDHLTTCLRRLDQRSQAAGRPDRASEL